MGKVIANEITKEIKVFNVTVGNDNGNSEHDLIIDGELIQQPNVYSKPRKLPNLDEMNPMAIASDIQNNLMVTIISNKINNGAATTYYIGNYAINSKGHVFNIEIGVDNNKIESDIPLVNTLGQIAGYAASKAYKDDNNISEIQINVDKTTALPINQYSKSNSIIMSERFMGTHKVTVYLGPKTIECTLNFPYVKTIPEAVPTVFYLQNNYEKNAILEDFVKQYGESDFKNKRILHVAIGEGTTEYPLTIDDKFDPTFLTGSNHGVGIAIEAILSDFKEENRLPRYTRQDYSNALKDPYDKYHQIAFDSIQEQLEYQAEEIFINTKKEVEDARNNVDIICVYGGGSILMKPYLRDKMMKFCEITHIQLLYIDKPLSVCIEAYGMYEFTKSDIFKKLKEKHLKK